MTNTGQVSRRFWLKAGMADVNKFSGLSVYNGLTFFQYEVSLYIIPAPAERLNKFQ